jgi:GNAT superfamily N-acetyltransferase
LNDLISPAALSDVFQSEKPGIDKYGKAPIRVMNRPSAESQTTTIVHRPIQDERDFWHIRQLLQETYPITPLCFNWEVRRWDGRRFYTADPAWDASQAKIGRVWEMADGRLVGAVHPDGSGDAHLQIHPDYRHIEEAMIVWAEDHLSVSIEEGVQRRLDIYAQEYDKTRRQLLGRRGYEKMPWGGVSRRLHFDERASLEVPVLADGYTLRSTVPDAEGDSLRLAILLNAAFNRDFHVGAEHQIFAQKAPCFRQEMDIVAVAPDGSFAAYVGIPYDEATRHGIFEPVCTHPDHQRKGLARTLMLEGLHRLRALGAQDVTVETGDMIPANRLYDSLGFTGTEKGFVWRKIF